MFTCSLYGKEWVMRLWLIEWKRNTRFLRSLWVAQKYYMYKITLNNWRTIFLRTLVDRYQPFSHFWIISDFYASIRNWLQKEILFRLKVYNIYLHICQNSNKNLWNYFIDMLSTYYTVDTSTSYQISMLWCCR